MQIQETTGSLGHDITKIIADTSGYKLLVLGGIHGDEACGSIAINELIRKFKNKELHLKVGELTLIPECNIKACEMNKRYIDIDLNRAFYDKPHTTLLEEIYANVLKEYIQINDYLLDIHSTSSKTKPFAFDDINSEKSQSFVQNLGVDYIITGWPDLYEKTNDVDTLEYAISKGATGTVVECGQHSDKHSIDTAISAITNALSFLKMIDAPDILQNKSSFIKMTDIFYVQNEEMVFKKEWENFSIIAKDEIIAQNNKGDTVRAPDNGIIIMPNKNAKVGDEWFYFGKII